MGLWDWSLAAYGRPGVAQTLLALQDESGQNVCLLLWAAWARVTEADVLVEAAQSARRWEQAAVAPLRALRRTLKAPDPVVGDDAREGLRTDVKAAELRAERILLDALEPLTAPKGGDLLPALQAAAAAWGGAVQPDRLADLATALAPQLHEGRA